MTAMLLTGAPFRRVILPCDGDYGFSRDELAENPASANSAPIWYYRLCGFEAIYTAGKPTNAKLIGGCAKVC